MFRGTSSVTVPIRNGRLSIQLRNYNPLGLVVFCSYFDNRESVILKNDFRVVQRVGKLWNFVEIQTRVKRLKFL